MLLLTSFKNYNTEYFAEKPTPVLSEFITHLMTNFLLSEEFPSGAGNISQNSKKELACDFNVSHSDILDEITKEMYGRLFPEKSKPSSEVSIETMRKAIKNRIGTNSVDKRELELDKQIHFLRDDVTIIENNTKKTQEGVYSAFSKFIPEYEKNHQLIFDLEQELSKNPGDVEIQKKLNVANNIQREYLDNVVKKEILQKGRESVLEFRKFMHEKTKEIKEEFESRKEKILDALKDQTDFKEKLQKLFNTTIDSKINKRISKYFSRLFETVKQYEDQKNKKYTLVRLLKLPVEIAKPVSLLSKDIKISDIPYLEELFTTKNTTKITQFVKQVSDLKYFQGDEKEKQALEDKIFSLIVSDSFKKELIALTESDMFQAIKSPKKDFTSKKNQAIKLLESLSEEKKKQPITFVTKKNNRKITMTLETAIKDFPFVFNTVPENNNLDLMGENGKTKLSSGEGVSTLGISLLPFASAALGINLCPYSTAECQASCLGHTAGGAIQYADTAFLSKLLRTYFAFTHPKDFAYVIARDIYLNEEWAKKTNALIKTEYEKILKNPGYSPSKNSTKNLFHLEEGKLVPNFTSVKSGIRFNVTSDIPYHEILPPIFFDMFAETQFYDYTKNFSRIGVLSRGHKQGKMKNYFLSLSHTGSFEEEAGKNYSNDRAVIHTLKTGGVVSSVFGAQKTKKAKLNEENLTKLFELFDVSTKDKEKLTQIEKNEEIDRINEFEKISKKMNLEKKVDSFVWSGTPNKSNVDKVDKNKTGKELFAKYFADFYLEEYVFPKFAVVYNNASDEDPYLFPCVNGDQDDNVYDRHSTANIPRGYRVEVDGKDVIIGVVSALKFKGHEQEVAGRFMNPLQQMELPVPYQISKKDLLEKVYGRRISQIKDPSSLNRFPVLVIGKHLKN